MTKALWLSLLLCWPLAAIAAQAPSVSQQQSFSFAIERQPLADALLEFAVQSNSSLVFDSEAFTGLYSRALQGDYRLAEGLRRLLAAAPVSYDIRDHSRPRTIVLTRNTDTDTDTDAAARQLQLSKVVVRGYAPGDWVYSSPNSDAVISKQQLEKMPPLHTADLFSEVSGVFVAEDRSNPGLSVNIRGMQDFGRVNMTLDGARQNYQQSGHGANGQAYVDAALIRQVDIKKGPSSRASGAGVVGGVVNFSTINADDLLDVDETLGARLSLTRGVPPAANGYRLSGSAALAYRRGQFDMLAAYSEKNLDDYDGGHNGSFTGDADSDQAVRDVATQYTQQDQDARLLKSRFHLDAARYLALNVSEFNAYSASPTARQQQNSSTVHSQNLIAEYASPQLNSSLSRTLTRSDQVIYPGSVDARFDLSYQIETYGGMLEINNDFSFGHYLMSWFYGAEYFIDRSDPQAQQLNFTDAADYSSSFSGPTPQGERAVASLFSEWQLESQQGLQLRAGVRYDHYRLQGKTHFDLGIDPDDNRQRLWRAYIIDRDQGKLLPTLSLGYELFPGGQLFAGYARGWRPPAITETLMYGQHVGNSGPPVSPNPELKAELNRNIEFGFNLLQENIWLSGDVFKSKLALYNNRVKNYMINAGVYFPAFGGVSIPGESISYRGSTGFVNLQQPLTFQGVELNSEYDTGRFYSKLNYTYTELDYQPQYDPLPNGGSDHFREFLLTRLNTEDSVILVQPPAHKTTLDVGMRWLQQRWVGGIRLRYFSANKLAGGPQSELQFNASQVVDLYSSYRINNDVLLRLSLENASDQLYATPLTLSSSHIGPGRTLLFTVTANF